MDWTQIGNVLERPSQLDLTATAGLVVTRHLRPDHPPPRRPVLGRSRPTSAAPGAERSSSRPTTRPDRGRIPSPCRRGHRPRPGLGRRGELLGPLLGLGGIARCRIDPSTGRRARRARPHVVGDRPAVPRGTTPLRAGRDVVPPDRRGRHVRRARGVRRAGPLARRALGGRTAQPDPQSPQHRPADSEHRATPTSSRRPTEPGGWSCWGCARRASRPASTCSAARPS